MRKALVLLLLIPATLLHAQQFSTSVTSTFKQRDDFGGEYFKFGNNYVYCELDYGGMQLGYTFKLGKVHYTVNLHSYDAGMKEIKKISLDDGKKILGPFPPYIFAHNQKLQVIYYRYFEDDEVMKLYITQINPADLSVEATKELLTIDQKNIGFFQSADALEKIKLLWDPLESTCRHASLSIL